MILEAFDKFEYKHVKLSTSINTTIKTLNELGNEGWEVIKFNDPQSMIGGTPYEALLKRKITRTKI